MVENNSASISEPRFFFTEPWEPVIVRRGDALGLSALLDQFADAVAPDFSNRIRDGRWVTILAWCLVQSQQVFDASGGRSVSTRKEQNERYAWLQPLELMWVARTITLLEKDDWKQRSLAGQRRVAPWNIKKSADRFGMSPEQFRAYRQTGMYGGYRLAFRKWPGMTSGDGWTPGQKTRALAKWLDSKLKGAQLKLDDELGRSAKTGRDKECNWWLNHWKEFAQSGKDAEVNTLPRRKNNFAVLPEAEILKPIIFGDDVRGQRRVKVVRSIRQSTATNHLELCQHLSSEFKDVPVIVRLYTFSRLADAGIAVMEHIATVLGDKTHVELKEVAKHKNAASVCKELRAAAQAWLKEPDMQMRHIESAYRFAAAITSEKPIDCLSAVLEHHKQYGGGLRWFVLCNGKVRAQTESWLGATLKSASALANALRKNPARHSRAKETIYQAAHRLFRELLDSNSSKAVLRQAASRLELLPGALGMRVLGVCEPSAREELFMRNNQPDMVIKVFGSPFGPDVLVVTDKLSEGIDLHRYCRHLIHYELDPSPIRTVQRNGRIRRVNSWAAITGEKIRYAYPAFGGTRDQRLVEIMKKRVATFSLLLGGVQDFDMDSTSAADEIWRSEVVNKAKNQLKSEGGKLRAKVPGKAG